MENSGGDLLLADDDPDDCSLFQDALAELSIERPLIIVHNGEELMVHLYNSNQFPDIIFLDLNMPGKNGFECLKEIKMDRTLREIPVIIISTSSEQNVIDQLYSSGAQFYIRKPNEFSHLKNLIANAIQRVEKPILSSRSNFIILP
ncbi:MAG: response regulator [Chitinophagales bacterium]